jgi:heme/copper-type cytochrome/quinol oxidase subunit 2
MRARQGLVLGTLAASVLFLVSAAAQDQGQVREFTISGNNYAFAPASIQVNRNDLVKITFTAHDIPHSFVIEEYRIVKRASAGQTVTFEFRADQGGTFTYFCSLTQDAKCRDMKGILTVR